MILSNRLHTISDTPWWPDFLGLLMLGIGLIVFLSEYFGWSTFHIPVLSDLLLRVWPELIGIGLAVIIIDNANELLRTREEKKRLILQMGSPNNEFAIEAVRQLRVKGWMFDGSLRNMYFRDANLDNANLQQADLRNTNLKVANLRKARLSSANLSESVMEGADLNGAFLIRANIQFASLAGANLEDTELHSANLLGASLNRTDLRGAILKDANLHAADLRNSKLGEEIMWFFSNSDTEPIRGSLADLSGAFLDYANLEGAIVTNDQLSKAKSLEGAIMPDGTVYNPETFKESLEEQESPG